MTDIDSLRSDIRSKLPGDVREQDESDFIAYEVPTDMGRVDFKLELAGGKWHSIMNERDEDDTVVDEDGIVTDSKEDGLRALQELIDQYEYKMYPLK